MTEFIQDHYRQVPRDRIIDVDDTPAMGRWTRFFPKASCKHPAKMNQLLLRHLLQRYTKPGDVVLDPMAGTFSTIVQAVLLGRHGVGVELEEWMIQAANETVTKLARHKQVTAKGDARIVHGDARELSSTLQDPGCRCGLAMFSHFDAAILSPPYQDTLRKSPRSIDPAKMGDAGLGFADQTTYDAILTSPPYGDVFRGQERVTSDEETLRKWWNTYHESGGGMSFEAYIEYQREIQQGYDAVVTSPPHGRDAEPHGSIHGDPERRDETLPRPGYDAIITSPPYGVDLTQSTNIRSPENPDGFSNPADIARNRSGYDAILTSPPHADVLKNREPQDEASKARRRQRVWEMEERAIAQGKKWRHGKDSEERRAEIDGRGYDAVVTSPPYGDQDKRNLSGSDRHPPKTSKDGLTREKRDYTRPGKGNIGRLAGESYLEAMSRVYHEAFKVLKPGGTIVVVVKNFVRDYRPVRLDEDTTKLLHAVGFQEVDHLYRRIKAKSFWIRTFEQRFRRLQKEGKIPADWPMPTTKFEDVLVFRKHV